MRRSLDKSWPKYILFIRLFCSFIINIGLIHIAPLSNRRIRRRGFFWFLNRFLPFLKSDCWFAVFFFFSLSLSKIYRLLECCTSSNQFLGISLQKRVFLSGHWRIPDSFTGGGGYPLPYYFAFLFLLFFSKYKNKFLRKPVILMVITRATYVQQL